MLTQGGNGLMVIADRLSKGRPVCERDFAGSPMGRAAPAITRLGPGWSGYECMSRTTACRYVCMCVLVCRRRVLANICGFCGMSPTNDGWRTKGYTILPDVPIK